MPTTELIEAIGEHNEELIKAGIMVGGGGGKAWGARQADRVRRRDSRIESERDVRAGKKRASWSTGFWIWGVKDMNEAVIPGR